MTGFFGEQQQTGIQLFMLTLSLWNQNGLIGVDFYTLRHVYNGFWSCFCVNCTVLLSLECVNIILSERACVLTRKCIYSVLKLKGCQCKQPPFCHICQTEWRWKMTDFPCLLTDTLVRTWFISLRNSCIST